MLLTVALAGAGCVRPLVDHSPEVSLGTPARGYLVGASRLADRGVGYELFRTRSQGGHDYGTRRLVTAIEHAARYVHSNAAGGAPLRVGDLSERNGGNLMPRHHSHRSGRDADILFYALDSTGRSVPAPDFVRYDASGVTVDATLGLQFDVARNWLLVESLVRDESSGVIRIFVAEWLRQKLLAYAREHHRNGELVVRAEWVLRQPGDAAAHDDHFHIRVACTPEERALGCIDGGPLGWWLEREFGKGDEASVDDASLVAAITDPPIEAAITPTTVIATASNRTPSPLACTVSLSELRGPRACALAHASEP
jgi:penicillin-insensitive murein endopeptidase